MKQNRYEASGFKSYSTSLAIGEKHVRISFNGGDKATNAYYYTEDDKIIAAIEGSPAYKRGEIILVSPKGQQTVEPVTPDSEDANIPIPTIAGEDAKEVKPAGKGKTAQKKAQ